MLSGMRRTLLLILCELVAGSRLAAAAGTLPCQPCAGLRLAPPPAAPTSATAPASAPALRTAELLGLSHLPPKGPLFVAWEVELAGAAAANVPETAAAARAVSEAGGTPWL